MAGAMTIMVRCRYGCLLLFGVWLFAVVVVVVVGQEEEGGGRWADWCGRVEDALLVECAQAELMWVGICVVCCCGLL